MGAGFQFKIHRGMMKVLNGSATKLRMTTGEVCQAILEVVLGDPEGIGRPVLRQIARRLEVAETEQVDNHDSSAV